MTRAILTILPQFTAWLTRETGIDAQSLGTNTLERAVLERMRATQAGTMPGAPYRAAGASADDDSTVSMTSDAIDIYWQLLNASPDERLALIEVLVVPETWFFRDRGAFTLLSRLALESLRREPTRVLRVLSVPCATGEEPYSIAMALLDAGLNAERFTIDALDISARAIGQARIAMYGRNSFRGHALEFRERHFSAMTGGWQLNQRVQQAVRFTEANLFESLHGGDARYDFIFCRNVLIYFDRDAQDRAVRLLETRLADHGTIFVGPSETGLMTRHAMSSARVPLAFAFQHARPEDTVRPAAAPPVRAPAAHSMPEAKKRPFVAPPFSAPTIAPVGTSRLNPAREQHAAPQPTHRAKSRLTLDEARRQADAGQFAQAERLALEFVTGHGPDGEAFYLLGLIADARGRSADAGNYYRKALYLEPAHYEALTHLATLLDMTGDSAGAQQLMRRAQRAVAQTPKLPAEHVTPLRGPHGSRRN